jgi:hypothetical protein
VQRIHLGRPAHNARRIQPVASQWQNEYVTVRSRLIVVDISTENVRSAEAPLYKYSELLEERASIDG